MDSAAALTEEHHAIDGDIEDFLRSLETGTLDSTALKRACDDLRRHIYIEEELLFPPIRAAGLMMPVFVMVREHGEVWRMMDALEELLRAPKMDVAELRSLGEQLLAALAEHNAKEEPIVYPHAAVDLSEDEAGVVADFIAEGSMPADWVCEAVR